MQQPIKREEYLTLHCIIEQAHKKYLKESRINKQTSFNILRILSAFKQMFPTTPDHLYKLIMVITKKYNPQSLQQWTRAIQKINTPTDLSKTNPMNSSSFNLLNMPSHSNLNESSIKRSQSRMSSRQMAHHVQNSTKTYKEELDNEIDYIESKRSRLKFVGDFRVTEPSWMGDTHHNNTTTMMDENQEHQHSVHENKENIMQFSNKNSLRNSHSHHAHLISFEPTYKDSLKQTATKTHSMSFIPPMIKQQSTNKDFTQHKTQQSSYNKLPIKKINPYHEITRIDNLSLIEDREPTSKDEAKTVYSQNFYRMGSNSRRFMPSRTQRDYSVGKLGGVQMIDSKDDNNTCDGVSVKRSEAMTHQEKVQYSQILQFQEYNMSLDQWECLNQRAITFYDFNSKLKAFSAIMANYQAFESDRVIKNKADVFHAAYLGSKVFIGLKNNVQIQLDYKEKLNKAEEFYQQSLKNKTWKILKVLSDLRINSKRRLIPLQKLNRINYEFFLSFMFQEKSTPFSSPQKSSLSNTFQQSFDLQRKAEYFSKTQNFQNVWNIYKCFGLNISISKDRLTSFFNNYHQSLKKIIFSLLKKNVMVKKDQYLQMHEKRLMEKAFSMLVSRRDVSKELKQKYCEAELYANKKLKQKTFKILLSIVYSTKIFSKRQQFIESQKINRTKISILKKWIAEYKSIQLKKKVQSELLSMLCQSVTQFLMKVSFRSIKQESEQVHERMCYYQNKFQQKTMRKVLLHLSTLISKKKKFIDLCQSNEIDFQKKMLAKWLSLAKVSKGISSITANCKKIIYRKSFIPLVKSAMKSYLMKEEEEKCMLRECFQALRENRVEGQARREQLVKDTQDMLFARYNKDLLSTLRRNHADNLRRRLQEQIAGKSSVLTKYLNNQGCQNFFSSLTQNLHQTSSIHQNITQLLYTIKSNTLSIMTKTTTQSSTLRKNSQNLKKYLTQKQLKDITTGLKRQQVQNRQAQLNIKRNKSIFVKFTRKVHERCQRMSKLRQKSVDHFEQNLQRRVLYCLAMNYLDVNEKTKKLEQALKQTRKIEYLGVFVKKSQKETDIKAKAKTVQKLQPFSALRQNFMLKARQKLVTIQRKETNVQQVFTSMALHIERKQQNQRVTSLSNSLKTKLFWMRLNQNFIESLISKKHVFMAYKFRALKLYELTFKAWKEVVGLENDGQWKIKNDKRRSRQKDRKRDQRYEENYQQKQSLYHMYKPTDCS